jgi:hypothetical protein
MLDVLCLTMIDLGERLASGGAVAVKNLVPGWQAVIIEPKTMQITRRS